MSKNKHMTLDDRYEIEHGLNNRLSFKKIAEIIGKDCTTVSKEVRTHLLFRKEGAPYRPFNDCLKRRNCPHNGDVCIECSRKRRQKCSSCGSCAKNGRCVFDDEVNLAAPLFAEADGLVIASPVYYASANGTLISFLDRLFYSAPVDKRMKVGASVTVARRGGLSATFDELNKYFTIAGMPVASSQYWNSVHGGAKGEAEQDGEGLQTMRVLARNMTFLMKSIALGREQFGLPEPEGRITTSFIR